MHNNRHEGWFNGNLVESSLKSESFLELSKIDLKESKKLIRNSAPKLYNKRHLIHLVNKFLTQRTHDCNHIGLEFWTELDSLFRTVWPVNDMELLLLPKKWYGFCLYLNDQVQYQGRWFSLRKLTHCLIMRSGFDRLGRCDVLCNRLEVKLWSWWKVDGIWRDLLILGKRCCMDLWLNWFLFLLWGIHLWFLKLLVKIYYSAQYFLILLQKIRLFIRIFLYFAEVIFFLSFKYFKLFHRTDTNSRLFTIFIKILFKVFWGLLSLLYPRLIIFFYYHSWYFISW